MDTKSAKHILRQSLVTQINPNSDLVLAKIISFLKNYLINKQNHRIVCGIYCPIKYEPDILDLTQYFDIDFSLPKIVDNIIHYVPYSEKLEQNKLFPLLLQPSENSFCTPDIIFVPGIAFDRKGYRLGLGKGHYDKYIEHNPNIYRVGICFDNHLLDNLPTEPHDRRMHVVITETEILYL